MGNVRFLLGPAGSGKTHRCLAEIREELRARPAGPPLLLLAPKQATYQLERQLLDDQPDEVSALTGYARLQILSFDRLAGFVLDSLGGGIPRLLSEEGRLMVLRALLGRHHRELEVFRATARLPGFARQLSQWIREWQRHQVGPVRLRSLADEPAAPASLRAKLRDLALLMDAYQTTLAQHRLEDADGLPDLAADCLRRALRGGMTPLQLGGVWLDGFAEMTLQELDLLVALLPGCAEATLAFCLEGEPREGATWLNPWALVAQTVRACRVRVEACAGVSTSVEILPRGRASSRFGASAALQHLEANWAAGGCFLGEPSGLEWVEALHPEEEALVAARAVLRQARAGVRYREMAVIVRELSTHAVALRRVFTRFGIPFFLDQRESVAHHPLVELTRSALRLVAFGWLMEDWLAALKSGLVHASDEAIDELENLALERGWDGPRWLKPFPTSGPQAAPVQVEDLRRTMVEPFLALAQALGAVGGEGAPHPGGRQLVAALRSFWESLQVLPTLERWSAPFGPDDGARPLHTTVWQQMLAWLDNLALAFADDEMPLREWLPVLEAGWAALTVGVIPPSLDQVLIGAVDRSRNPELNFAVVLGLNEGRFPAPPPPPSLLNEAEALALEGLGVFVGAQTRLRIAHERYFAYIAFTRASERVLVTSARMDSEGKPLNPSPFLRQLQRMFPALTPRAGATGADWRTAEHLAELGGEWLRPGSPVRQADRQADGVLESESPLWALEKQLSSVRDFSVEPRLSPAMAARLLGLPFRTSVSSLEQFGMCPFRFFLRAGLRIEERMEYEIDPRRTGDFQHEVLCRFHQELTKEGRRWRDLTGLEARERMGQMAAQVARVWNDGMFDRDGASRLARRTLTASLQDFVQTVVEWMPQYAFDPVAVELGFGVRDADLPPWMVAIDEHRQLAFVGRIDRVDLGPADADGARWVVVLDYKSSARHLDPWLLANGVQLQLPAYLAVLRGLKDMKKELGVEKLRPAGIFYINLKGEYRGVSRRDEALEDPARARRRAFRHSGRFDFAALPVLDNRGETKGDQFAYELKRNGDLYARCVDPMRTEQWQAFLDQVEEKLRTMGRAILDGCVRVDPYAQGSERPCDKCEFAGVCRIDPWTHRYRALQDPGRSGEAS